MVLNFVHCFLPYLTERAIGTILQDFQDPLYPHIWEYMNEEDKDHCHTAQFELQRELDRRALKPEQDLKISERGVKGKGDASMSPSEAACVLSRLRVRNAEKKEAVQTMCGFLEQIDLKELGEILRLAWQYCCGRQTYMPGVFTDYVAPLLPLFSRETLTSISQTIRLKGEQVGYGHPQIDEPGWIRFLGQMDRVIQEKAG